MSSLDYECINIGFTGTRAGMTQDQMNSVYRALLATGDALPRHLHHGCCVGADSEVGEMAEELKFLTELHPPTETWALMPGYEQAAKRAYRVWTPEPFLQRNQAIVHSCRILIAAPKEPFEVLRSGTWSTVRYAQKLGKPILVVYRDGRAEDGSRQQVPS